MENLDISQEFSRYQLLQIVTKDLIAEITKLINLMYIILCSLDLYKHLSRIKIKGILAIIFENNAFSYNISRPIFKTMIQTNAIKYDKKICNSGSITITYLTLFNAAIVISECESKIHMDIKCKICSGGYEKIPISWTNLLKILTDSITIDI